MKAKVQISRAVTGHIIGAFFRYTDSILIPLLQNFKSLDFFCGCTARFMSELVENLEDGSHVLHFAFIFL